MVGLHVTILLQNCINVNNVQVTYLSDNFYKRKFIDLTVKAGRERF